MTMFAPRALVGALALLTAGTLTAAPFTYIRIGDRDGFGYNVDPNFASLVGDGGAADRNSDGKLDAGDVLPSLNGNDVVATGDLDDFDNRLGETVNGSGFVNTGTTGLQFTDISLSTSYDASKAANQVYNANTGTYGAGGLFPSAPSTSLPNQPGFLFNFKVAAADITVGNPIFFNMLFGDYDVTPASIQFNFASSSKTLSVTPQNNAPNDGLIQGAFASLSFSEVFTWDGVGGWNGLVGVNFNAPNEPYTAFDYVELSLAPFQAPVPEPALLGLLGAALAALGLQRRRASIS